tara:strand:+ start:571 stop:1359 length:789 start_codon:yes stop_codon:yes gene_type:complete
MQNLKDRVAIVTGGSLGIGAAGASSMANSGAKVVIMDINKTAGEEVIDEITSSGGSAHLIVGDASAADDCKKTISETVKIFGGLDILFNNVGIQPPESYTNVEDTSEEMWDRILSVNLKSRFLMAKYSIPEMKKRGGGVIISTASVQGHQSANLVPAYAATKGADLSLTRQLAIDYGPDNIRVLSICPGAIDTPLWRISLESKNLDVEDAILNSMTSTPLGRVGQPEDLGEIISFLASDAARYMTGTFVNVDGGLMAKGAWA